MNKNIKNVNSIKKNFFQHSSHSNIKNIGNAHKLNDYVKDKNLNISNPNFNQYINQNVKNSLKSNNSSFYNLSHCLQSKDPYNLLKLNQNKFSIKSQKNLLNDNYNKSKNDNDNDNNKKNKKRNQINNSFQEINDNIKNIKNEENLILKQGQSYIKAKEHNNLLNSYKKFLQSLSRKEISNLKQFNLNKPIASYNTPEKISKLSNKLQNKSNSNSLSKNLSNASTEKYSFSYEQLAFKSAYNQTTHITLQSIPDEKLLKMSNNYLDTDKSLENFQKKNYLNNN